MENTIKTELIEQISKTVANHKFVNRWLVLLSDVAIAVVASLCTFMMAGYLASAPAASSVYLKIALIALIISSLSFLIAGTYKGVLRYSSLQEIWKLLMALLLKTPLEILCLYFFRWWIGELLPFAKIVLIELLVFAASAVALSLTRVVLVMLFRYSNKRVGRKFKNVLIYGTDDKSVGCLPFLEQDANQTYNVVGFVVLSDVINRHFIANKKVYCVKSYTYLSHIISKHSIQEVVFPSKVLAASNKDSLIPFLIKEGVKVFVAPDIEALDGDGGIRLALKEVKIEDLLGRDEIEIEMSAITQFINDKCVMVTGAAGSIGSELCRLISKFDIKRLVMLDNGETPMHNLTLEFSEIAKQDEELSDKFSFYICDVRNKFRLKKIFKKEHPQIVFHAAAYKHVPLMEMNPTEAVSVNIFGTKNVADLAVEFGVEKMIMISTDKAVNPTNVMGASKRIAEIYTQALSRAILNKTVSGSTKFITTRFGNVLGSNGSVIPLFKRQIAAGGPVTVTHKDIVRYFMSIPEACRLVLEAAVLGQGYEIFVFDMGEPIKIVTLAENMIRLAGFTPGRDIQIKYVGLRPGEKLYEELLNTKENSIGTKNRKIFIARVREVPFDLICKQLEELMALDKEIRVLDCVRKMKEIVPEYKSKNSIYEQLDKLLDDRKEI